MIRLSERMEHIVELAKDGQTFPCAAEIGCDHAYIIMEIVRRGYAAGGIAMDVKKGPLKCAAENIEAEFKGSPYAKKVTTRLSDGLSELKEGEAQLLVIAGMGGGLIRRILEEGRRVCEGIPVWILQPQTEYYELRKYLSTRNYQIVKEDMVFEDGKFYPMFKACKCLHKEVKDEEDEIKLKYGPLLLKEKNPCLLKYLLWEEAVNRKLFGLLQKEKSPKAEARKREIEGEYLEIQRAKSFFDYS